MRCGISCGKFIVSCGDAAQVLDAADGALDDVAALVGLAIEGVEVRAAGSVGDGGYSAPGEEQAAQRVAVIGPVSGERDGGGQPVDQIRRDRCVAAMAARDGEGDQLAMPGDQRVLLRGGPAARATYGVGVSPPFPPAAERCALPQVLSNINSVGGPPVAARVSNALCQTPFLAQRIHRLWSVLFGP